MSFGTTVRDRRKAAGLTQQALASAAGISYSTMIRIERGEDARVGTMRSIAEVLGCSVSELLEEPAA